MMNGGDEENSLPPEEVMPLDQAGGEPEAAPQAFQLPGMGGAEEPSADTTPEPDILTASNPGLPDPEGAAEAVEAMLSAELLPEGGASAFPEASPDLPEHPTFQLQFRTLPEEARAGMKKALAAAGVTVADKAWTAAVPVISQLTEYQAVLLLQNARALGLSADAAVVLPHAAGPSEEDLALGDLSSIPEAAPAMVEAAPSVTLPKGEKDVLLCTPDRLPGGTVRETFGIIVAHRSIARRLFREEDLKDKLQKELRSVPNAPAVPSLASSHLQLMLRELMLDLRKSALGKGANSVLGVKIEAFPESGIADPELEQLRLVAFGTAAVVEKS